MYCVGVKLIEIKFSIFLNFFDVILKLFFYLFSIIHLSICLFYIFAFLCFVILCFVIDPSHPAAGQLIHKV